jgi:hypothetical protein
VAISAAETFAFAAVLFLMQAGVAQALATILAAFLAVSAAVALSALAKLVLFFASEVQLATVAAFHMDDHTFSAGDARGLANAKRRRRSSADAQDHHDRRSDHPTDDFLHLKLSPWKFMGRPEQTNDLPTAFSGAGNCFLQTKLRRAQQIGRRRGAQDTDQMLTVIFV